MAKLLLCSAAVLVFATGALRAADEGKNDRPIKATITKVDPQNQTITVRMKDKQGKEVERTFELTEDLRMVDEAGQVVTIDVFRAGNEVLLVEQKGRLVGVQKSSGGQTAAQSQAGETPRRAPGLGIESQVDQFMKEYDRNKNGYLEREELPAYLRDQFDRLDTNKDKKLSRDELIKGWVRLQETRRPSDLVKVLVEMSDCDECACEELQQMYDTLRKLDKNHNGKIEPQELEAFRKYLVQQRVDRLLTNLDTDHDGRISRQEARGQLRRYFDQIDTNHDGYLERDELIRAASEPPAGMTAPGKKGGRHSGEL